MRLFLLAIAKLLVKWCDKTGRTHHITGGPNGTTVYMVRYILVKNSLFSIYLHRFLRSDMDDPYDHPWNFATYILKGEYTEHQYDMDKPVLNGRIEEDLKHAALSKRHYISYWTETKENRGAGSLSFRPARTVHRIAINKNYDLKDLKEAPFIICFMGRRRRQWGFWPAGDGGAVFVDWRKYLNIKPGDPRLEGSE